MGTCMSRVNPAMVAAYKLFRAFHRRGARKGDIRELEGFRTIALEVGEIVRIQYASRSENVERFHVFKKSNRPVLFVSSDGSQAYILAGGYRFTAKGFEG